MMVQDPETPRYIAENSIKELDKLETHMLKDGYDRTEVETMRTLAYKEAYAAITAYKEYKSSAEYKEMQAFIKKSIEKQDSRK